MAWVASDLRRRLTFGSWGSTHLARDSASCLLDQTSMSQPRDPAQAFSSANACKENIHDTNCLQIFWTIIIVNHTFHLSKIKNLKLPDVLTWCEGDGCLLSRAWCGNALAIFLATQWLANIMHSATVSWTPRCSFGLMLSTTLLASNSNWTSDPDSSLEERESKIRQVECETMLFLYKFWV